MTNAKAHRPSSAPLLQKHFDICLKYFKAPAKALRSSSPSLPLQELSNIPILQDCFVSTKKQKFLKFYFYQPSTLSVFAKGLLVRMSIASSSDMLVKKNQDLGFPYKIQNLVQQFPQQTLCEKGPYSEFSWSVFPRIWSECGEILRISRIQSNAGKHGPE